MVPTTAISDDGDNGHDSQGLKCKNALNTQPHGITCVISRDHVLMIEFDVSATY